MLRRNRKQFKIGRQYGYMYCTRDSLIEEDLDNETICITNNSEDFRDAIDRKMIREFVLELLKTLTDREFKVVYLRWFEDMTLEKVACEFNVSRERIRQIEKKAFRKIRSTTIIHDLSKFLRDSIYNLNEYSELLKEENRLKLEKLDKQRNLQQGYAKRDKSMDDSYHQEVYPWFRQKRRDELWDGCKYIG